MSAISEANFVDLYLGDGFADVKGLPGQPTRVPAPQEWGVEIDQLRERCQEHFNKMRISVNVTERFANT